MHTQAVSFALLCSRSEAGPAVLYHWALSKSLLLQVVTVNDYLARRDSEWVGQVHKFLGLQVGLIQQGISVSASFLFSFVLFGLELCAA